MEYSIIKKCRSIPRFAGIALVAAGVQSAVAAQPDFPAADLGQAMPGVDAIVAIQSRLPEVARWYDATPEELQELMHRDSSVWADRTGRLLYKCKSNCHHDHDEPANFSIPDTIAPPTVEAPFPLEHTFKLHSTPGASKVIYLDCDGITLTRTAWNNFFGRTKINAAALDNDGDPSTFNDSELAIIQQVWQRVAEDYAPFDVDVTTEDPGDAAISRSTQSDEQFGMRAIVTSTALESSSGVAYIGVFDEVGDDRRAAWVFSSSCLNDPRLIAEACAHEVGHTLGLYHDGTTTGAEYYNGHAGWAPIMGGAASGEITQWSKGEYPNANNKQDDLLVIQSNGLTYHPDDHGSTLATATPLTGTSLSAIGAIEKSADWDMFVFTTGAGSVTFSVTPASCGPNLDIALLLLDAAGEVVASASPAEELGAQLNLSLTEGTYHLAVFGIGTGDPANGYSEYGSLGQYAISGTVVEGGSTVPPPPEPDPEPEPEPDPEPEPVPPELYVNAIDISLTNNRRKTTAHASVMVLDDTGSPVAGAEVSGSWSGVTRGSDTVVTDANGYATISSAPTNKSGTARFAVQTIACSGYTYASSMNIETTDSIVIP
jgi:hypothetical protein